MRKSKRSNQVTPLGQDIKLSKSLSRWFILQTLLIVGVGVFITILIDQVAKLFDNHENLDVTRALTMVAVVVFVLSVFEILQYRLIKKHLEKICDTIALLSHGEYGQKLKVGKFDVFKSLEHDVNLLSEELENVQMLRNDFVNSYSHEFKTPIASIKGFAQLLLDDDKISPETRKKYLQIIADESERLTALAGNTILLSQLDTQKIITDKKPFSLDEQLRRCVIMLSNAWGAKNINVSGDICEATFNGNEDLLQHVWLNLLGNAIKFTPEGGKIKVASEKKNGNIIVSISDTGCGMDAETVLRVFDKYFRADLTAPQSGLGLGLSIARKTVELSGGKISVESELGIGTTFIVELPAS